MSNIWLLFKDLTVVLGEWYPNVLNLKMFFMTLGSPLLFFYSKKHIKARQTYKHTITSLEHPLDLTSVVNFGED